MKKLLLPFLFLMMVLPTMSQGFVSVSGTVTDTATGNPIPNHAVTILSDSTSGFVYYNVVYTNASGFYVDTVYVVMGVTGTLFIQTLDCNNLLHQEVWTYTPLQTHTVNFVICYSNNPCQAGFTHQQIQPLTVQFTDASTGGGITRQWVFGDGGTSSLLNPIHSYSQAGYYTVTLTIGALGSTCYDSIFQNIYVSDSTGGNCHAAFVAYPDSNALYSYHFWDQSTGNIATWNWNFGDGTFSSLQNPSHIYTQPGGYLVCLSIQGVDSTCFDMTCDTLFVGVNPPCQAAFTYYSDSLNTFTTVHFIDQSMGNIISWEWVFSDPGSGANNFSNLQNPTHIFTSAGTYNVCLTIHGADSTCYDVICNTIIVGTSSGCQANFTYSAGPALGNHTILFTDLSTGNPTSWFWSFGDGTSGIVQNPIHTYGGPGTYYVCLTITGNNCTSTFCQNVVVLDSSNYQQIYGQVYAGNFPISAGLAMIFSLDTNANYQPFVDVFPIDSNGVYYFTMVPDGNYYILAIPFDSNGYLPTYYGNTISWEQATVITLGTANNPYDINLVASEPMTYGPGSASGQINMGDLMTSMIDKVNMILINSQGKAIGFTKVTTTGAFDFSTLAYGTYYLHAEMPGVTSDQIMIILTPEKPHADVVMTFSGNKILGILDEASLVNQWSVYPNPVTDQVLISLEMKQDIQVVAKIHNLAGQLLSSNSIVLHGGNNKISLSTASLPAGLYTLRIYSKEGVNIRTKLIKTN